jgi:hypothetical protein
VAKLRGRLDRELEIAKRPLTQSPSYLDRERSRRAADRSTAGTATPENPDTGLSGGGFDLRTDGSGSDDDTFNPYHDSLPLSPGKQQLYERMVEQAALQKRPDETDEQSFSRFITEDPAGRTLFNAYQSVPVVPRSTLRADQKAAETDDAIEPDDDREEQDEAYGELMRLSRRMAKRCGITVPQAFERIYTDPKNAELVTMTKAYDFSGQRSFRAELREVQKAASDAYGELMKHATNQFENGKFPTVEQAFAALRQAGEPATREIVKAHRCGEQRIC